MLSVLAQVVPLALAAALSSVPLTATVLILLSPNRHRAAPPFLLGSVAGLALVVVAAVIGAGALPPIRRPPPLVVGIAELAVGLAILAYGVGSFIRSLRRRADPSPSKWFGAASSLGPGSAFALAIVLTLRPKSLLLGLAAGLAIAAASLIWSDNVVVGALYVGLALSTVLAPIVATYLAPARVEPWLLRIRDRLERHGTMVTAVVMVLVGVGVAGAGCLRLAYL